MSTFIRGLNLSKKWLKLSILAVLVLVCATAVTLSVLLSQKQTYLVLPEDSNNVQEIEGALMTANGWNSDLVSSLNANISNTIQNTSSYGDNVALGNGASDIISSVIELGGLKWTVVYKQNGVITLYANSPVATMDFGGDEYEESAVRSYLLNEFYPQFIQNVGFSGFSEYIIPYGSSELYYQAQGAQSIQISALGDGKITNNDGINGDFIWIPSAYEVGGFANTETSPTARVNSFRTINSNGISINTGLWNTSNTMRLGVNGAWLRSDVDGNRAVMLDGVVKAASSSTKYAVRPCINLALPETAVMNGGIVSANANISSNSVLTASVTPDYTTLFTTAVANGGGGATGAGTSASPYVFSTPEAMVLLSDAVMAGQTMSGKYFKLGSDIDMSSVTIWNPIGRPGSFAFAGNFDGQGYKISNLATAGSGLVGLFGAINGATITKMGVTDSSWFSQTDNSGAIAGVSTSSTISLCYSDSGVSGGTNVGGLVGQLASGTITNCYNRNAVSAVNVAGGIVGTAASGSTISYCYNTGSVAVTTTSGTRGGIAGSSSATITSCYKYNDASSSTYGSSVTSLASMQTESTFSGFTFNDSTWFMSNVLNDRMPMLKVFMKKVTVKVFTDMDSCTVSGAVTDVAVNTSTTLKANAVFTGTTHYRFVGWYHVDLDSAGNIIEGTERAYTGYTVPTSGNAASNGAVTFSHNLTANDYYYLLAKFERLYSFASKPLSNGFNTIDTGGSGYSINYSHNGYDANLNSTAQGSGVWYPEGTTVTMTIMPDAQRLYSSLKYRTNSTGIFSSTITGFGVNSGSTDANVKFVNGSGNATDGYTYNITLDNTTGVYSSSDIYHVQPVFDRIYVASVVIGGTTHADASPTAQLSYSYNGSTVVAMSPSTTQNILYNTSSIAASIGGTYTNILSFTNWTATAGSVTYTGTSAAASQTLAMSTVLSSTPADNITSITFTANFALVTKTITLAEYLDSTSTTGTNYGIAIVSSSTKSTYTADALTVQVNYGATVYVYIVPSYATGYGLKSNTAGATENTSTGVWSGTITANFTDANTKTYNVIYTKRAVYSINFAITGVTADASSFTLPSNQTGLTLDASVASGYNVTVASSTVAQKYFLNTVTATVGGKTVTLINYNTGSASTAGNTTQNIFAGTFAGSNAKTIQGIFSAAGATVDYATKAITITVNFVANTLTLTVNNVVDGVTNNNLGAVTITTGSGTVIDGKYVLNDTITITATKAGYKVNSISVVISGTTTNGTTNNSNWGNTGTLQFTMTAAATVTINYTQRSYTVTVYDNLNTAVGGIASINATSLNGSAVTNTYNLDSNTGKASGSSVTYKYGNTATISLANAARTSITIAGDRRAVLTSIVLFSVSGSTYTQIGEPLAPATSYVRTFTDNYDNIAVVFKYRLLQKVNVSFSNTSNTDAGANALLVVLTNNTDSSDRLVLIVPLAGSVSTECQVADYTIYTTVAIFVQTETSVDGSVITNNIVSVPEGEVADVNIDIKGLLTGSDSVFGAGTI